jgi:hypothetical protein
VVEPLLHLGDVGLVVECVDGGRCQQRVGLDLEAELHRICQICPHQINVIHPVRGGVPLVCYFTLKRQEQNEMRLLLGSVISLIVIHAATAADRDQWKASDKTLFQLIQDSYVIRSTIGAPFNSQPLIYILQNVSARKVYKCLDGYTPSIPPPEPPICYELVPPFQ